MFAALGEIAFEVVGSPETFDSTRRYDFAEHRVIESKPRLQWLGNDLELLKLEMMLHSSITNPAAQLEILKAAAAAHRALPLVFGNGGYRGFFVIEAIALKSRQSSADGSLIAITATIALKEWAIETEVNTGVLLQPAFSALGIITAGAAPGGSFGILAGVSALLSLASAAGATGPNLKASDVTLAAILRSDAA